MKIYIIAEVRESYPSLMNDSKIYNDYVSESSMTNLTKTLIELGYDCKYLGGTKELFQMYKNKTYIDNAIFINYNYGLPSNFKRVQSPALLELMRAKYSGSDPFTSLLVNDKAFCKKILSESEVLFPKDCLLCSESEIQSCFKSSDLQLPLVIKPNSEGSSLGINSDSLCNTYEQAKKKAFSLIKEYSPVLVEEYIAGYECTVWLMGNDKTFPFVKPLIISCDKKYYYDNKIFTMQDKSCHKRNYDLPENILSKSIVNRLIEASKTIFNRLGLRDYARIDFRINNNDIYFIEANALPIFSKTSEIGAITQLYNISYEEICDILINVLKNRLMP